MGCIMDGFQIRMSKFAIVLFTALALSSCNQSPATTQVASDPLAVVRAQADALNRRDWASAIVAVDPESPTFEHTKEHGLKLFQTYDLRYTLKDLTLESMSGDEARVRFVQVTEKVSGPAFRDNRVAGVHTLRKRNGEWRIFNTQITKVEYLDE